MRARDLVHVLLEVHAVGKVGQHVVAGQVLDARLVAALLGDVLVGRHPAAIGQRLMPDGDRTTVRQLHHESDAPGLGDGCQTVGDKVSPPPIGSLPASAVCRRTSSSCMPGRTSPGRDAVHPRVGTVRHDNRM